MIRQFIFFFKIIFFHLITNTSIALTNQDKLIEHYNSNIKKNYSLLVHHNSLLIRSAENFCNRTETDISELKNRYRNILNIWTKLQHIRFGPINDFNNYSRIQFWPDKRGVVNRQYLKSLQHKPKELLQPGYLGLKSVAIQGLPVLERLIFEQLSVIKQKNLTDDANYSCAYMISVLKNLQVIYEYVYEIWMSENEFAEYFEKENFFSEYFNSILSQLEFIEKSKLASLEKKNVKVKDFEFWRSSFAMNSIYNNISEINQFYINVVLVKLKNYNPKYLKDVDSIFGIILKNVSELEIDYFSGKLNKYEVNKLIEVRANIKRIHSIFLNKIATDLSIQIGFNRMDGD